MSCKCFNAKPAIGSLSFSERFEKSKCACSARYVVSERNARFSIEPTDNLNAIDKVKIDAFLIPSTTTKKCDYLFVYKAGHKPEPKAFVFVELKGVDYKTGVVQLEETVKVFQKEGLLAGKDVRAALACKRIPGHSGTSRSHKMNLAEKFKSSFKSFKFESKGLNMTYDCRTDRFGRG